MDVAGATVLAKLLRATHGTFAEEFSLRMIRHFEQEENPAAHAWRLILNCLEHLPASPLAYRAAQRRPYRRASHPNGMPG